MRNCYKWLYPIDFMLKKGELTSEQIVLIVLSLIGFAILLYFLIALNIEGKGEEQACKLALLARASAPSEVPFLKESLPVACTTSKTCITGENGNCVQFFGNGKYTSVKVSDKDATAKIEETIANEYVKCWDTVGRGNLQVFGSLSDKTQLTAAEPKCLICARIGVDGVSDSALRNVNLDKFVKETKLPGSELTYQQSLAQGSNNINSDLIKDDDRTISIDGRNKEYAIVFMQITAPKEGESAITILSGLGVGALSLANPLASAGKITVLRPVIRLGVVAIIATAIAAPIASEFVGSANRLLAASYCGTYNNGKGTSYGCSVLQIVPYTANSINQLCDVVEGSA